MIRLCNVVKSPWVAILQNLTVKSKIYSERRQRSVYLRKSLITNDTAYIGEITHVLSAPVIYLLWKDILALTLIEPTLQDKDIVGVVTFFGEDVSTTCPTGVRFGHGSMPASRIDIMVIGKVIWNALNWLVWLKPQVSISHGQALPLFWKAHLHHSALQVIR